MACTFTAIMYKSAVKYKYWIGCFYWRMGVSLGGSGKRRAALILAVLALAAGAVIVANFVFPPFAGQWEFPSFGFPPFPSVPDVSRIGFGNPFAAIPDANAIFREPANPFGLENPFG
jgi:hypothetical protein